VVRDGFRGFDAVAAPAFARGRLETLEEVEEVDDFGGFGVGGEGWEVGEDLLERPFFDHGDGEGFDFLFVVVKRF